MAHFAELDDDNVVLRVLVIGDEQAPDPAPSNSEPLGVAFLESLGLGSRWKQTSLNGNFRKQYADIGYTYDEIADVFIAPRPWPSWTLNENYDWVAPVPVPEEDGVAYLWDEEAQEWVPSN